MFIFTHFWSMLHVKPGRTSRKRPHLEYGREKLRARLGTPGRMHRPWLPLAAGHRRRPSTLYEERHEMRALPFRLVVLILTILPPATAAQQPIRLRESYAADYQYH